MFSYSRRDYKYSCIYFISSQTVDATTWQTSVPMILPRAMVYAQDVGRTLLVTNVNVVTITSSAIPSQTQQITTLVLVSWEKHI